MSIVNQNDQLNSTQENSLPKTIIRKVLVQNFTMIDNAILRNTNISWKAKGLLCYLIHLPDDWQINLAHLELQATDGMDSLKSGMKELKDAGYIDHMTERDEKGKILKHIWLIFQSPDLNQKWKTQQVGNPQVGNPQVGNPVLPSTKEQPSTKEHNNKVAVVPFACLAKLNVPDEIKLQITAKYSEAEVEHAVAFVTQPNFKPSKDLTSAFIWACKEQPIIPETVASPPDNTELLAERREEARRLGVISFKKIKELGIYYNDTPNYVTIGNDKLFYDNIKYDELLKHYLKKVGL
jgi:hypothetical protein